MSEMSGSDENWTPHDFIRETTKDFKKTTKTMLFYDKLFYFNYY
jgi:hypothetical protein